ncbi:MAG: type IV conjugative transfer system protein TraL [Sulfurimonas sp.]|jgi:type IV conjugative transfer system protein TraL|nr:type IV conjugative transfer system protein TraL [Sulfurimonas sp.]
MSNYIKIYRSTNKDITIGNYTLCEIAIPIGGIAIAKIFQFGFVATLITIAVAIYLMILIKELNETKVKGYYLVLLWWYGIISPNYKTFPKSHEREFVK